MKECPTHKTKLIKTKTRYGIRFDCPIPDCDVMCWNGETSTPANQETRSARTCLHVMFDPLWRDTNQYFKDGDKRVRRTMAYKWLAEQMNLPIKDTHVGMFTLEQCYKAYRHVKKLKKENDD